MRLFLAFIRDFVKFLVVGKGMRIRPRHVRMNKCGSLAFAHIFDRFFANAVAFNRIRSIAFRDMQTGKSRHQLRNASARGLHFNRHGNRVAVVFDQIQNRQFLCARDVQRFPKFSFARRAVAR